MSAKEKIVIIIMIFMIPMPLLQTLLDAIIIQIRQNQNFMAVLNHIKMEINMNALNVLINLIIIEIIS
jgi:hypothetical protein